jgi:hypothetical protein
MKNIAFFPVMALGLSLCALHQVQAVTPPPDGGYPSNNTAEGTDSLLSLTTGISNTAIGFDALLSLTTGSFNTATGAFALQSSTTGSNNTASGFDALATNTIGFFNTANGYSALAFNTTGYQNTATGVQALLSNTGGSNNTASGAFALVANTTGSYNTASGYAALFINSTGNFNTANGWGALYENTIGTQNVALGYGALNQNTTGSYNIGIGPIAGSKLTTGKRNIDIGNQGVPGESHTIRLGDAKAQRNTYIAGITGVTVAGGVGVLIDTNGHLGTVTSSARYKEGIKPMDKSSEAILALKPVTFRYKQELDPDNIPQFGLVAEQVEKVDPDLVARDDQGKPYTVRYEAVNAMLLNEFLKEHRKVEALETNLEKLEAVVKAQAAQLQGVRDQIQASKPVARPVSSGDLVAPRPPHL